MKTKGLDWRPLERPATRAVGSRSAIEHRAFADRPIFPGAPDVVDVPAAVLTSESYARRRAAGISLEDKTDPATIRAGDPSTLARESAATTHFSVVDSEGMAVACTTTLNVGYAGRASSWTARGSC